MEDLSQIAATRQLVTKVLPSDIGADPRAVEFAHKCMLEFLKLILGDASLLAASHQATPLPPSSSAVNSSPAVLVKAEDIVSSLECLGFYNHSALAALYLDKLKRRTVRPPS